MSEKHPAASTSSAQRQHRFIGGKCMDCGELWKDASSHFGVCRASVPLVPAEPSDTDRLDWLEENQRSVMAPLEPDDYEPGRKPEYADLWHVPPTVVGNWAEAPTLREAIDAVMQAADASTREDEESAFHGSGMPDLADASPSAADAPPAPTQDALWVEADNVCRWLEILRTIAHGQTINGDDLLKLGAVWEDVEKLRAVLNRLRESCL